MPLVRGCIEQVNQSLAQDSHLSSSQIRRFLILHKELDPDDGELTRTRKVRRRIINERYGDLIEALFDGRKNCFVSTEVMFEDGRQGQIEADLEIRDAAVSQSARAQPLEVRNTNAAHAVNITQRPISEMTERADQRNSLGSRRHIAVLWRRPRARGCQF